MKNNKLENYIIVLPETFKNILKKINKNSLGIIFATDKNFKLIGSITDGDIRRSLIKKKISNKIDFTSKLINKKVFSLSANLKPAQIIPYLGSVIKNKKINCIPLVDTNGVIVDISTLSKLKRYPLISLDIGNEELKNLTDCVRSGWISSLGPYVIKFEKELKDYVKGKYLTTTTSGTTALELAVKSLGLTKGDEIIVPDFTFAASINSIINAGCKPVIVDVEKDTWTIDINKILKVITKKTKAIMAVHIYGQPSKLDELKILCKKKKLFLLEDAAEALGAKYKNKIIGSHGDCVCFSFFANKTITTGEGGAVIFKEKKYFDKAVMIKNHGMLIGKFYDHKCVGSNYRMTNIQAAIGCAQLKKINLYIFERKKIFDYYNKSFIDKDFLLLLPKNNWSTNSYWLYSIVLKNFGKLLRNQIIKLMQNKGIECRPGFPSLSSLSVFNKFSNGDYPVSNFLSENLISFPSNNLTKIDQDFIIKSFLEIIKSLDNPSVNL